MLYRLKGLGLYTNHNATILLLREQRTDTGSHFTTKLGAERSPISLGLAILTQVNENNGCSMTNVGERSLQVGLNHELKNKMVRYSSHYGLSMHIRPTSLELNLWQLYSVSCLGLGLVSLLHKQTLYCQMIQYYLMSLCSKFVWQIYNRPSGIGKCYYMTSDYMYMYGDRGFESHRV